MNFDEAERARRNLDEQQRSGKLTAEAYCAEINKIRVTDAKNTWWQPDPRGPGWLCWNGKEWVAGIPPAAVAGQAQKKPAQYHFRPVPDSEPGYKLMSLDEFRFLLNTRSWKNRPRKWWDLFSILLGVTLAFLWFVYSSINPRSEGWDFITPLLMIAIPLFLVSCRKPIDELLMPLQPHRQKFPRLLLLAAGICVPFLTAFILLNLFHIREYSLIRYNMVIGTCLAYAVTRDPVLAGFVRKPEQGGPSPSPSLKAPLAVLLFLGFVIHIVRGDDCASDPLNASDCLRTSGYGEGIAGAASAAEAGANAAGDSVTTNPGFDELTKTLEPGTWHKTKYGCVKVNSDGSVTVRPDSSGTGTTDSGTPNDRLPAGTSESTTVNPETGESTTTITWPDGKTTTTTTSADGNTVTTVGRDGSTSVTTKNSDGSTTNTTTTANGEKSTSIRDRNGLTITKNADGSITTDYPDGTRSTTVTNSDGSSTTTWRDGRTVTTDTDGTVTTVTTNPDGSTTITVQNPDGSTDVTVRGGPKSPDDGSGELGGTGEPGDGEGVGLGGGNK